MNNTQAATLLAKINTFDQRSVTPQMAESWAQAIKKTITLEYAVKAVIEYYGDPRWGEGTRRPWIMPADINNRAPAIKNREHPQYHVARQIEAPKRSRRIVHHFAGSADFKGVGLGDVVGVSPHD